MNAAMGWRWRKRLGPASLSRHRRKVPAGTLPVCEFLLRISTLPIRLAPSPSLRLPLPLPLPLPSPSPSPLPPPHSALPMPLYSGLGKNEVRFQALAKSLLLFIFLTIFSKQNNRLVLCRALQSRFAEQWSLSLQCSGFCLVTRKQA